MRNIDMEEYKEIELKILLYLDQYCQKNNLRYYLAGGSLLGALRHKGFIPWDDDIDIIMPRPDYMYLVEHFNDACEQYKFKTVFNEPQWYSTFGEIEDIRTVKIYKGFNMGINVGITIDIFPMDGSPSNSLCRRLFWFIQNFLARIFILSTMRFTVSHHYADIDTKNNNLKTKLRTIIKFCLIPLARCTKGLRLNLLVNKIGMLFDIDKSNYIGVSVFPHYGYAECVKAKPYLKITKQEFEGHLLNVPDGYEEYLENLYGDYMRPPSVNHRVSHHNFEAYWKDDDKR